MAPCFPGGSVVKNPPANAGYARSMPGWGRPPGEENGNPLQCACLNNRPSHRDQEGIRGSEQAVHRTLVFPSSETRVSGNFCANIKVANYRFKLQDGTWGFSWDAVAGKGLILRWRGNHVVFLELRRDFRITMGNSGFLLCCPREVHSSIRGARDSRGLLSSHFRANETSSMLVSRT